MSEENTVRTWNLRILKQEFIFEGHTDSIQSIKFTDNKNLLGSGTGNKKILIWDLNNKTQFAVLDNISKVISIQIAKDLGGRSSFISKLL